MSTSLSRRIRRIGALPTSFNETQEQRLVTEIVEGKKKEVEKTFTKRTPVRHQETLTPEEHAAREAIIRTENRQRTLAFRAARKAARKAARLAVKSKAPVKTVTGKKAA